MTAPYDATGHPLHPYAGHVPNVSFRSKPSRVPPAELRERLAAALAATPGTACVEVAVGEGRQVVLRWVDGPAAGTVADLVATVVNWEVRTVGAPPSKPGVPSVVLARAFSDAALAVAVVRYQASNVRPYASSSERAVATLGELLEVDDPAHCRYPVPAAMAEQLLAAPDPADLDVLAGPDASPADRLAAKLAALGYDRLWNVAWKAVG
jgi:hypothetical protein